MNHASKPQLSPTFMVKSRQDQQYVPRITTTLLDQQYSPLKEFEFQFNRTTPHRITNLFEHHSRNNHNNL
jgi:hypothetical protein